MTSRKLLIDQVRRIMDAALLMPHQRLTAKVVLRRLKADPMPSERSVVEYMRVVREERA